VEPKTQENPREGESSERSSLAQDLTEQIVRLDFPTGGGFPGAGTASGRRILRPKVQANLQAFQPIVGRLLCVGWSHFGINNGLEAILKGIGQSAPKHWNGTDSENGKAPTPTAPGYHDHPPQ